MGRYNHFAGAGGASIYWSPTTGAHFVRGVIRAKWAALGWETGRLRYPITDEKSTPDGVGKYNDFSGAYGSSVYFTPTTGAHAIQGAIRAKWASLGWETSGLGYPTTDEYSVPVGRASEFQRGQLTWNSTTKQVIG